MKKTLLLAAFALLTSGVAMAQKNDKGTLKSYSFIEAQGGAQWTTTNAELQKLLMPIGAISFGHYFTPAVGARLHVDGWKAKGRFKDLDLDYKWNFITADADLLLNLSSIFSKNYNRPLNVIFVGGVGLVNYWNHKELNAIVANDPLLAPLAQDNKHHFSHNLRAGLRLETNVTKPFGISLEVDANNMDDRFNGKTNSNSDDWMISAMLGLSWRFGHKYIKKEPVKVVRQVEEEIWVDEPDTIIVKEKRPVVKEEEKDFKETIFYKIAQSDVNKAAGVDEAIKKVADLMKTSEDANFTVTGYADKGTGTPKLNKKYAKQRAEGVAEKLVKEHGLDASRLKTDSKGDTVQPFEENDKNRCVIITGHGTFKVTTYEEYEVKKPSTKKVKKTVVREVVEEI